LTPERYEVRAEPGVSQDLAELAGIDDRLVDEAIRLMGRLRDDPWLGEELRERYNMRAIADCRKIRFDLPDWPAKPRYRIVYRNDPSDGAVGRVRVWSVGPRNTLVAYARANTRVIRERVRKQRRRRGSA
jgi:hypothetical protein